MERVLALGGFLPPCSCFIFPLGCLAGPVTSMRVGSPFSPPHLSCPGPLAIAATGAKSSRYVVFPHVVCVSPVSTPWRALSTFCPWAPLSPSFLSFRWVRRVPSALVDSHSCLVVPWLLSAPLSSSLASPCIQCGSWPLTGWTVPLAGSLLAPSGALESFLLFSLPLRVPLAFEIACRTRSAFPVCYLSSLSCWVFSLCSRFPTLALLVLPLGRRVVVSPVSSGSCLPIHLRLLVQGVFSLSCPSTFLGCSVPPDGLFLLVGVFYPYGVGSCSFLHLLSRVWVR